MTTENNENLNEVKEVAAHKDKPQDASTGSAVLHPGSLSAKSQGSQSAKRQGSLSAVEGDVSSITARCRLQVCLP